MSNSRAFDVVARLDRATQYSRDVSDKTETPLECWMPRSSRGMTARTQTHLHVPAAHTRPGDASACPSSGLRGRRECRVQAAPEGLACKGKCTLRTRGGNRAAGHPAFPARVVLTAASCSPRSTGLVSLRRLS